MADVIEQFAEQSGEQQTALAVWVLSGLLVLVAYLLPNSVGQAMTGVGVITVAVSFIGSGLIYLALIPVHPDDQTSASEA